MRRLGAAAVAALVAGCGSPQVCTAVNCLSRVVVVMPAGYADVGGADRPVARICIEDGCGTTDLVQAQGTVQAAMQPPTTASDARPVTVRVTVTRGSRTVASASTRVTLEREAPNGESCGPVCFTAALRLTEDNQLVPA